MSRKQKKTMDISPLEEGTASEETIELSEPSGSQEQGAQSQETPLNPQIKAYLDTIIQNTAASLAQSMRQYMDQQFETMNRSNNGNMKQVTGMQHTQSHSQEPTRMTSNRSNADQFEGNYPFTLTLNRLIIEADVGARNNEKQEKSGVIKYKATSRKFPTIDYSEIKQMPS
ncbi:23458_t:CDS:2, partial [Gigaspora rosea]